MWNLKNTKKNEHNKKKKDSHRAQTVYCQRGGGRGGETSVREIKKYKFPVAKYRVMDMKRTMWGVESVAVWYLCMVND